MIFTHAVCDFCATVLSIQDEIELQEFRRIRTEQDTAYEESLAVDRERVCCCFYFLIAFFDGCYFLQRKMMLEERTLGNRFSHNCFVTMHGFIAYNRNLLILGMG